MHGAPVVTGFAIPMAGGVSESMTIGVMVVERNENSDSVSGQFYRSDTFLGHYNAVI